MRAIALGQQGRDRGKYFALVDDDVFDYINQWRWWRNDKGYAVRETKTLKRRKFYMHKIILPCSSDKEVDHRNGDRLDNQRHNLRIATGQQNSFNRRKFTGASIYKGVSRYNKKWRAKLIVGDEIYWTANFKNELHAAMAYDIWAKEHFGEFAVLNFPLVLN